MGITATTVTPAEGSWNWGCFSIQRPFYRFISTGNPNVERGKTIVTARQSNGISYTSKTIYIEGILPKGPYLPWRVSMAGRALLAGYHRYVYVLYNIYILYWNEPPELPTSDKQSAPCISNKTRRNAWLLDLSPKYPHQSEKRTISERPEGLVCKRNW